MNEFELRREHALELLRQADRLIIRSDYEEALMRIDNAKFILLAEILAGERDRMRAEMQADGI